MEINIETHTIIIIIILSVNFIPIWWFSSYKLLCHKMLSWSPSFPYFIIHVFALEHFGDK